MSSPGNLTCGTYAVALTAKDEAALRSLADSLARAGLPHHMMIEVDKPYEGQAMAIGLPPCDRRLLKRHLSKFPLLRAPLAQMAEHPE